MVAEPDAAYFSKWGIMHFWAVRQNGSEHKILNLTLLISAMSLLIMYWEVEGARVHRGMFCERANKEIMSAMDRMLFEVVERL